MLLPRLVTAFHMHCPFVLSLWFHRLFYVLFCDIIRSILNIKAVTLSKMNFLSVSPLSTSKRRITLRLAVLALLAITFAALVGCSSRQETVLGVPAAQSVVVTANALSLKSAEKSVTLQGEMTEKCPVAGCWFMLRDKTGIVRVDTKNAGFVVTEVPVHTQMTVTGTVASGTPPGLNATGIRY